ncbi:hypothetical protein [Flagellimonas oceani]|nr:hypothetical protein [Allomuricauda oceani]
MTAEKLRSIIEAEKERVGEYVYSDKRRTAEEMLRMLGEKV